MNPPSASDSSSRPIRVLLAAGGTGGHIYPAIALAEALRAAAPGIEIQFCCGSRPAELQIYSRMGIQPWVLPVSHHRPGLRENWRFLTQMIGSWRMARRLLKAHPVDVAVGFGSYVSIPPLLAARRTGAKLALHEQNVHAGSANRLLKRFAARIAVAEEPAPPQFPKGKTVVVGNPVRAEMLIEHDRAEARRYFRLKPDRLVCLCVGGSQGAAGLNQMLLDLIGRLAHLDGNGGRWQLLWSTGTNHYKPMMEAIEKMAIGPEEHALTPFIEKMGQAYAAADLVLARSGALTLAELTALGKPSILVPLPTSAAGHQEKNARRIEATGAAVVLEQDDKQGAEKLEAWLGDWAEHPEKLMTMAEASRKLGKPGAAGELAGVVLELAGGRR